MENQGLCKHLRFSRESKGYPGDQANWERHMAYGGLATLTRLAAREHAAECAECARVLAELDPD